MERTQTDLFMRDVLTGRLDRRQILAHALRLGVATPVIAALLANAPRAEAASGPRNALTSAREQGDPSTFTALIEDGTGDIDPHSSYTTIGSATALGAYEMLIQYKGESTSEFAPMLAQTWEANPENTSFTFTLPTNALFHDGTPCDANAVKASFVRFRRLELGPYIVLQRFCDNPEEQIEVVDATTIRFNLPKAEPLFLSAMASSYGPYVVSPAAVEANKSDDDPYAHEFFLANAVGTGPYRLVENNLKEQLVFERFEEYHRGWEGNHFSTIIFRVVPENATRRQILEQGEADAATNVLTMEDYEALKAVPDLNVLQYPTTRVDWSILNAVRLSKEARQGLCYAFPYQQVIDGVWLGTMTRTGPIPDNVRGYDPSVFVYQTDLAKAKELMLAGGLEEGATIDYMIVSESETAKATAQLFQASLAEIGYNLQIDAVDTSTQDDTVYGDAPAEEKPSIVGSWAWWPDYNDGWNQLAPNFLESSSGGGGSNAGYWVNERFEQIMVEAQNFTDEAQLNALMKEAQNILTEQDPAAIFHGQRLYTTVIRKDVQGFVANPLYLESYLFYDLSRGGAAP